jgi:hypothetical protein
MNSKNDKLITPAEKTLEAWVAHTDAGEHIAYITGAADAGNDIANDVLSALASIAAEKNIGRDIHYYDATPAYHPDVLALIAPEYR